MQIKDAIVFRFKKIFKEINTSNNQLAILSGITPSTVYSMMDSLEKYLSVITVKKLCDGLNITITEFFEYDIFKNLE